jgi:hypothetical protein
MTRIILAALSLALLAACAGPASRPVVLDGADSLRAGESPRVATARMTADGSAQRMELVGADGQLLTGRLSRAERPVLVPLAAGGTAPTPFVTDTEMAGDITDGTTTLSCAFRLLNPARGFDGGGSGRCTGSDGRTVDFRF